MIRRLHEGLLADGFAVPLSKLCTWFDVPRRTIYYKSVRSPPKIDPTFEGPIKAIPLAHAWMRCRAVDRREPVIRLSDGRLAAGL